MQNVMVPLSESTIELIVQRKQQANETFDEVIARVLGAPSTVPSDSIPSSLPDNINISVANRRRPRRFSAKQYPFQLFGTPHSVGALFEIQEIVLRSLAYRDPSLLTRISHRSRRTRLLVARKPEDLYPGSSHLARYSKPLLNGWWIGTNYSARDTRAIIKIACEEADIGFGTDIILNF